MEESTGPPSIDSDAILEEAKWIYDQLVSGSAPLLGRRSEGEYEASVKNDIENFLKFTHIQKFDVSETCFTVCIVLFCCKILLNDA